MNPDTLFSFANALALVGWLSLLAGPLWPSLSERVAGTLVPLLLSATYVGLLLAFWGRGEGGFDSLDSVAQLFQTREILLAGWVHYLAFDLFVGAWIAREGRRLGIPFPAVLVCLPLTFLFGPAGLLLFAGIRLAWARHLSPA